MVIKANGYVTINDLENCVCRKLIENIHNEKNFGRKLYCNGIIPLTPEKKDSASAPTTDMRPPGSGPPGQTSPPPASSAPTTGPTPPALGTPACTQPSGSTSAQTEASLASQGTVDMSVPATSMSGSLIASASPSSDTAHLLNSNIITQLEDCSALDPDLQLNLSDTELVRRHSLSLRTPPSGSIAEEILCDSAKIRDTPHVVKARNLLAEVKDLQEQLSDFASCVSSPSSDEDNTESTNNFIDEKRRGFKKRKASRTPPKEFFQKKQYLESCHPNINQ